MKWAGIFCVNQPNPSIFNFMAPAAALYLPLAFAFGAAMASFLSVVMDRLPAGRSIIRPGSHCDACGHVLKWHENLPIVGYLRLGGKCSGCGKRIPLHLLLNELVFAFAFTVIFFLYFMANPQYPVVGEVVPPYMVRLQLVQGWPIYLLHVALLSALFAMTVIDLKTYTIPIEITWVITAFAVIVHGIMPIWPAGGARLPLDATPILPSATSVSFADWVIPLVSPPVFAATIGGVVGIGIATMLLRRGVLRFGFIDFDFFVSEDDEIIKYPHARRELEWEFDYILIILIGMFAGHLIGLRWQGLTINTGFPLWCASLGGSLAGYFVGAGLIWGIRLFGTLVFGKEAMGLGDAHLLGCIGAVVGWVDPILIFLLAPFLAIFGMLLGSILGSLFKGFQRVLPYGPWLAAATVVVLFGGWWLEPFLSRLFGYPINLP